MLTLLFVLACPSEPASQANVAPAAKPKGRVDSVAAPPPKAVDTAAFCDARGTGTFQWPELDGVAPDSPSSWRWVNVWATWCKPCIAEMPMIREWATRLGKEGVSVAQQFLSVDATAPVLSTFMAAHKDFPTSPRLKTVANLTPWLEGLGLDGTASLPLHLFVDAESRVSCVRMGALGESDYAAIKSVLQGK